MNIYHYDATTKVYKSTTTAISGHGTPANATLTAPPTVAEGYEAVFNEASGSWSTQLIITPTIGGQKPADDFTDLTLAERLTYYGLGDLVSHVAGQTELAKVATVNAQVAALQTIINNLQDDVNAMGTTNATVTANQQLIKQLVDDFNRQQSTLLLEDDH